MHTTRRLLTAIALTAVLAACGGTEQDWATSEAEARGGKNATTNVSGTSVSASDASYGGWTLAKLYPGSIGSQSLFLGIECFQGGALVLNTSSYELHYAIQNAVRNYAFVGDHYEVYFGPLSSSAYTGGAASCKVYGKTVDGKGRVVTVATGTFSLQ